MKSSELRFNAITPTSDQLAFRLHEPRDAMYKTASYLVAHFWGHPAEMADGLGVLLLTWNQANYIYGSFDFGKLEECIRSHLGMLERYRARRIVDYTADDEPHVRDLFEAFLAALAIAEGSRVGARSPVAVAKAFHLLAPGFFPLWDKKIAVVHGCDYYLRPAEKHITFMRLSQSMAHALQSVVPPAGRTILKMIDEYNYAKYTKEWTSGITSGWNFNPQAFRGQDVEVDAKAAGDLGTAYFRIAHESRNKMLRIPLDQLDKAAHGYDFTDMSIDLGIALEALLLHDLNGQDRGKLKFRLSLRGAWLGAKNEKERAGIQAALKIACAGSSSTNSMHSFNTGRIFSVRGVNAQDARNSPPRGRSIEPSG
jgi:hypothetical protein